MSMLSISIHVIEIAEHGKDNSGSSSEMMKDDTRLVSDHGYTESWGRRMLFFDQSQLVLAMI